MGKHLGIENIENVRGYETLRHQIYEYYGANEILGQNKKSSTPKLPEPLRFDENGSIVRPMAW